MRALLIFAYSRYAQTAKIVARIFSPYVRKCWGTAVCEARPRQGSGTRPRGSPGLQTRALRRRRLWLWQVRALVRNARTAAARRGAACGRYRAIPCETQGGSSRAFLPGQSRASFRNPGFGLEAMLCAAPNGVPVWQRAALRQGWQVCGCSAVYVILQDWQDRRDVAQIGDIPETGDPRCQSHMPAPHARSVPDTCR